MRIRSWLAAMAAMVWLGGAGAATLQGGVVDTSGQPVAQAQVILERDAGAAGAGGRHRLQQRGRAVPASRRTCRN